MTLLRSIKGAPAGALLALLLARRAMTNSELQDWTGYSGETLAGALRVLVNLGWVTAHASGASSFARDGLLPVSDAPPRPAESNEPADDESASVPEDLAPEDEPADETDPESDAEEDEIPEDPDVRRALKQAGIREPAASRLAVLPHITPRLVRDEVAKAYADGRPIGSAIYRLEHGWGRTDRRLRERQRRRQAYLEDIIQRFKDGCY